VFENRVLRRMFGRKRNGVMGGRRKLHNGEHHDWYSSPSIIRIIRSRRIKLMCHEARIGEKKTAYSLLMGKPGGKRPLRRPRRRWIYNIKTDLVEVEWCGVDRSGLAYDM
jgi:hypothetical protein